MRELSVRTVCVAALFGALGGIALFNPGASEWCALGLIIIAGIPHGAFDMRVARARWSHGVGRSGALALLYVALGAAMSAACLAWPSAGFAAFLVISALHFIEGEQADSVGGTALVMGLGAITIPIGFHTAEAREYVGFFINGSLFDLLAPSIAIAARVLGVVILTSLVLDAYRGCRSVAVERAVCLMAWCALPPLAGFSVWFIGRHSWGHIVLCRSFLSKGAERASFSMDFVVISLLAIILLIPLALVFDFRILGELFAASIVLIAGLTAPHMVVAHGLARLSDKGHN